jgi:hypothetical protein
LVKNGTRLRSQVCGTQVIIVKSSEALDELYCGGSPMVALNEQRAADEQLDPALATGNTMGKRYVDDTGAEVLVTKGGTGTLSIGSTPLTLKDAKPLPASD